MGTIVGTIKSKKTGAIFFVNWKTDYREAWISTDKLTWTLVCTEVTSSEAALECAQRYIDGQPYLY
jgi:hypothetical protein